MFLGTNTMITAIEWADRGAASLVFPTYITFAQTKRVARTVYIAWFVTFSHFATFTTISFLADTFTSI
jgi:hypothetical protein